jgi:hypothetical protein
VLTPFGGSSAADAADAADERAFPQQQGEHGLRVRRRSGGDAGTSPPTPVPSPTPDGADAGSYQADS